MQSTAHDKALPSKVDWLLRLSAEMLARGYTSLARLEACQTARDLGTLELCEYVEPEDLAELEAILPEADNSEWPDERWTVTRDLGEPSAEERAADEAWIERARARHVLGVEDFEAGPTDIEYVATELLSHLATEEEFRALEALAGVDLVGRLMTRYSAAITDGDVALMTGAVG